MLCPPQVSALVGIICKRHAKPERKPMPEWEEMAAVACAVQVSHSASWPRTQRPPRAPFSGCLSGARPHCGLPVETPCGAIHVSSRWT